MIDSQQTEGSQNMSRRFIRAVAAGAIATLAAFAATAEEAPEKVRIGYAISKTGPNAGGAAASSTPNYELWAKEINAEGGLMLSAYGKRVPVEIVEYDDRSSSEEAVKAVERLITQDEVDLVLAPWGTGMNLAVAPILHKNGYPHLAFNTLTDRAPELIERWPGIFFFEGTSTIIAGATLDMLAQQRDAGKIGNKIAMIAIADALGIELSAAYREMAAEKGFELVYDAAYPAGTQDFTPILTEISSKSPDVFIANSYPPDTLTMTEQARVMSFNPAVYLTGIGTAMPMFPGQFGENVDGVMGIGGSDVASPALQDYFKRHQDSAGYPADRFASQLTYAGLEILQQAIENVGKIDRAAITEELKTGTFQTVLGEVSLASQMLETLFYVGQWQDGEFYGVGPSSLPGARAPVVPKPAWKN